jgi:hypothetical protein
MTSMAYTCSKNSSYEKTFSTPYLFKPGLNALHYAMTADRVAARPDTAEKT